MSAPARFVVGTGRCGSTLLSRMLAMNGGVLNVFELFSGLEPDFRFERRAISGAELAAQLRLELALRQRPGNPLGLLDTVPRRDLLRLEDHTINTKLPSGSPFESHRVNHP